jgi:hypothetical protein
MASMDGPDAARLRPCHRPMARQWFKPRRLLGCLSSRLVLEHAGSEIWSTGVHRNAAPEENHRRRWLQLQGCGTQLRHLTWPECVLQQGRAQQYCAEFPKGCELVTVHAAVLTECVRPCLCLGERFAQLVHRKGIPAMSLRHLLKEDSRDLSHLRT